MTLFYILAFVGLVLSVVDSIYAKKIKVIDSKKAEEQTEEDKLNKNKYNVVRGCSIFGIIGIISYCVFFIL